MNFKQKIKNWYLAYKDARITDYYSNKKMKISDLRHDLTYFKFYVKGLYYLMTRSNWKRTQRKELVKMLQYAIKHSAFFKEKVGDISINEDNVLSVLKKFPTITKQTIIDNKWNIFSDEVPHDFKYWRETGGSTGVPLKFPSFASSYYIEDVCQMMLYHMMGFFWGDTVVYFGGDRVSEEKINKNEYWFKSKNLPYGKYCYCVRYLNDDTFPYFIESLNKVNPKFLRGFTSSVKEFCRFVKKKNIKLQFQLKGIYLTSESATLEDRKYIESVLHCPVWRQYGHTECSIFAIAKPNDLTYYANPLYGYTEILDEDGNQVAEGSIGEITVTGFNILGIPFVRYRTGDLAVFGGETKYGETILKELLGRSRDFLYDDKGNKVYALSLLFDAGNLNLLDYIKAWQIEQNEEGFIIVRIIKDDTYNKAIEKDLINVFKYKNITINIVYVDDIAKTKRGKHKFIIQNYKK